MHKNKKELITWDNFREGKYCIMCGSTYEANEFFINCRDNIFTKPTIVSSGEGADFEYLKNNGNERDNKLWFFSAKDHAKEGGFSLYIRSKCDSDFTDNIYSFHEVKECLGIDCDTTFTPDSDEDVDDFIDRYINLPAESKEELIKSFMDDPELKSLFDSVKSSVLDTLGIKK